MSLPLRLVLVSAAAALTVNVAIGGAAHAQAPCGAAVEQAKTEWRSLTHVTHVAPSMRIDTSDGRHLTGSQLNYVWVLIDRADGACSAARVTEAMGYLREIETILHPPPRQS